MTLLERDREKYEEGIEVGIEQAAKALFDILDDETIASKLNLPLERVKVLRKEKAAFVNEH